MPLSVALDIRLRVMENAETEANTPKTFQNISGGWSFILNNIEITHSLPFEIAPGIRVNRASPEQTNKIKSRLQSLLGDGHFGVGQYYECDWDMSPDNPNSYTPRLLPEEKWRYYIVDADDNGRKIIDLQYASNTSLTPIDISSIRFMNNGGMGWRIGSLQYHFFGKTAEAPQIIGFAELNDLADSYKQYIKVKGDIGSTSEFPEILRAQELLDSLSLIPQFSDFHIIGLFAIVEMLITHNPKLEDRGDSITHQMQSKIPLLSKRFKNKIFPAAFFGNASEKKIWSALYKYRSTIAHGGIADFSSGDLQLLKDQQTAKMFLLDVVRKMIRHAFTEPVLYRDLRAC